MGFKNIVLSRIDFKEKEIRKVNKSMEFIWRPFSQIPNSDNEIFTHIQWDGYCMPGGLDALINDKEIVYNTTEMLANYAKRFYETVKTISSSYAHNQVLFTYGCDFSFRNKTFNFKNIETIMEYINSHPEFSDVRIIYSTPSVYFKVIKEMHKKPWPVYENQDFFPYAEHPFSYWTGYFSSRPYLKGMVRDAGNFLLAESNLLSELIVKNHHTNKTVK